MITINEFAQKNVVIVGLGVTGYSAADALQEGGASVYLWDDNPLKRAEASSRGYNVSDPLSINWKDVSIMVLSPGIPLTHPEPHPAVRKARLAGVPIVSDVDLLGREQRAAKYIGITGTNGKTSTTALIGHVFEQARQNVQVGGNIGQAALTLEPLDADGVYVLEMSSYLIDLTKSIFYDAAVLLNITPDHLDRHGGLEGYVQAKQQIFNTLKPGAASVVGMDDARCARIYHRLKASGNSNVVGISARKQVKGGVYFFESCMYDDAFGSNDLILDKDEVTKYSPSLHRQNVCAAYAVCRSLGLSRSMILENMLSFRGMSHRQEVVSIVDGVLYVNDSKATNMDAVRQALYNFDNIFWILGGRYKGESLNVLSDLFPKIRKAFVIGEAVDVFSPSLSSANVDFDESGDLEQAIKDARVAALASGIEKPVVLFSPACSSFDQYQNFEERGNAFCELVKDLPGLHTQLQIKESKKVIEVS